MADTVLAAHEFRTVPVGEFIFEGVADVPGMWIFQEILGEGLFPTRTTLCSLYGCAFISIIEKTLTIGTEYQKYSLILNKCYICNRCKGIKFMRLINPLLIVSFICLSCAKVAEIDNSNINRNNSDYYVEQAINAYRSFFPETKSQDRDVEKITYIIENQDTLAVNILVTHIKPIENET